MVDEVVVDTNVFLHAHNPEEPRFGAALAFCEQLAAAEHTAICVDEGFGWGEASNESLIGSEYLSHIPAISLAAALIGALLTQGRVHMVSQRLPQRERQIVNQLIRNKRDRTFVRVAWNCSDRLLVSHDYQDFGAGKRRKISKLLTVSIVGAEECPDPT